MKSAILTTTAIMALAFAANGQNQFGLGAGNGSVTGSANMGVGDGALGALSTGNNNTVVGEDAASAISTGSANTAVGQSALYFGIGNENTGIGHWGLLSLGIGDNNTALGSSALAELLNGNGNIAVGRFAGGVLTNGDNNIYLGNSGNGADLSTIRIGQPGVHTNAYFAGVSGVAVTNAAPVVMDANGQLGTADPLHGLYILLPSDVPAPAGYTKLGTMVMKYKVGKKTSAHDVDVYQKD